MRKNPIGHFSVVLMRNGLTELAVRAPEARQAGAAVPVPVIFQGLFFVIHPGFAGVYDSTFLLIV